MADSKISALTPITSVQDTDVFPVVRSGATAPAWGVENLAGVGSVNGWGVQNTTASPSGLATSIGSTIAVGTTAAAAMGVEISGWIFGGGTAGPVKFRWAQNTSDAGNLTVKKGLSWRL